MNERAAARCPIDWRTTLLVVSLWIPATLFLGGRLGWWNDDYFFNGRNPATGRIEFWIQAAPTPFDPPASIQVWRPLNFLFTTSAVTLFWNHDWIVHGLGAIAHLVAGLLLHRVLSALRLSSQACMFGTLLFVCCPIGFEAIFWASAIATGASTSMLLGVTLLYIRYAQHSLGRLGMICLVLLAAAIPLVNEQPAPCLAAFPFLYFGVRRHDKAARSPLRHALRPLLLPAFVHALYLGAIALVLPSSAYGSAGSFVPAYALPGRLAQISKQMVHEFAGANLGLGALRVGWGEAASNPLVSLVMGALILASVLVWHRSWMEPSTSASRDESLRRRAWLALFVLASLALSLLPLAAIGSIHVRPRMAYATSAFLAIAVAIVGNRLRDWGVGRSSLRASIYGWSTGAITLLAAIVGALMLMGVQAGYRARSLADRKSLGQLASMVGRPGPGTFFLPLAVDNRAVDSGTPRFDWYFASAWYWSYAYPTFARQWLHRDDVESGFADGGRHVFWSGWREGFEFKGPARFDPRHMSRNELRRVPWEDAIPFEIGFGGEVTLLSPITLEREGLVVETVLVPGVEAARARGVKTIHAATVEVDWLVPTPWRSPSPPPYPGPEDLTPSERSTPPRSKPAPADRQASSETKTREPRN